VNFYRVTSRWFVAGLITNNAGTITGCAAVLKQFKGWDFPAFQRAAKHSQWKIERLLEPQLEPEIFS
jgi:hypothetical protein